MMKLRPSAVLERAIDVAVLGALITVAIRTKSELIRVVVLIGAVLMLLAWFVAWRRR